MADFYGTVAAANAYHIAHGNAGWTGTDDAKEAALLRASEWIDQQYGSQFPGYRSGKAAQVREWPRKEAYDIYNDYIEPDAIPSQVDQAVYVAALREIVAPGSLNVDWTPGKEKISVAVSGAVSVTYAGAYSYADAQIQIGGISSILRPILSASSAVSSLSGRSGRV